MAQPEDQQHLHRPASHPAHHDQPFDHLVRRHPPEVGDRRNRSGRGVVGEVVDGPGLGLGEAGGAQLPVRRGAHQGGRGEGAGRIQRPEPVEDGPRGLARKLLKDDRARERGERAVARGGAPERKLAGRGDVPAEHRVPPRELGQDPGEVQRREPLFLPQARNRHPALPSLRTMSHRLHG